MKIKSKYYNAPKLKDSVRINATLHLPEVIYNNLKRIAKREKRSFSWVIQEVLIDFFNLEEPETKRENNEFSRTNRSNVGKKYR